jgi:SAM-dependent MidA family methyltransferase
LDVGRWALDVCVLQTGDPALIELIREQIRAHGPVSFAWFMEQALYHPEFGYYAAGRCEIGRRGDYYTNVSVGPLFGRLLAAQFVEIWAKLGKSDKFTIVEQGAHHGEFASDALESIRDNSPNFFSALQYCIVEPFGILRDRQAQRLGQFGDKIVWSDSIDELTPFIGIHFSNELFDSLPVHLVVRKCRMASVARLSLAESGTSPTESEWREKFVALEGNQFVFVEQPITNQKLQTPAQRLPRQAADYVTEVNLAALDWIDSLAAKLTRGYLLAIDYGYPRDEFHAVDRTTGTLQIRTQHRSLGSPFEAIGHSDITAHIEWTSVAERAEARGLRVAGFTDQHHFLIGIISELAGLERIDPKTARALQTLLHPEMLGRSFQVLALAKNIDSKTILSGFKFARDGHTALGL